jgi:hypothetical protein
MIPKWANAEVQIPMLILDGMMHLVNARRLNEPSSDPSVSPGQLAMCEEVRDGAQKEIYQQNSAWNVEEYQR